MHCHILIYKKRSCSSIPGSGNRQAVTRNRKYWIDIGCYEPIKYPLATVDHIYTSLEKTLPDEACTGMQRWLQQRETSRKNEIRHSYTPEEYGLSNDQVMTTFKPYPDFAKNRSIEMIK